MEFVEKNKPVNFYFGNGMKEEISKSENKEYNYIIIQNDFLHRKNEELVMENNNLIKNIEELESENESLEKSKTCLKGYIKNSGEYSALSKKLVNYYNENLIMFKKKNDEFLWDVKVYGAALISVEFIVLVLCFSGFFTIIYTSFLIYFSVYVYTMYNRVIKIKDLDKNGHVLKIKEEMKKAEQGNDYLNDICDML